MNLTKKQEQEIESIIEKNYEAKTRTRQMPSLKPDWTPPLVGSPLTKEDARQVDKALRDLMRPNKPRD